MYYAYAIPMDRIPHANIHLGLLGTVFYLHTYNISPTSKKESFQNKITAIMLSSLIAATIYVYFSYDRWLNEASPLLIYSTTDLFVGGLLILIVLHGTWRAFGRAFGLALASGIVFGLTGPYLPGILNHPGMTTESIIFTNTIGLNGLYGFILQIGATWVAIFILFAGLFEGHGGMDYLISIGKQVAERSQTGVANVAVITSAFIGSLTGSSAANAATTGSFTIPFMKQQGISSREAAGIESMASTGSQIMPPVMGTASFLMADIVGVPYFQVVQAGLIPALLFYIPLFFAILFLSNKHDWAFDTVDPIEMNDCIEETRTDSETDTETSPSTTNEFEELNEARKMGTLSRLTVPAPYIISVVVLIHTLLVLQYDPLYAGLYSTVALLLATISRDIFLGGITLDTFQEWFNRTLEGSKIGVVNLAPISIVMGSLGVFINIIDLSGFTQRFAVQMVGLAGGILIFVAILAMLSSLLFGLGMPGAAAYVTVAIISAPTLIEMGLEPLNVHLFVFYFSILSAITPPVAVICAITANIAQADFWETAVTTLRIGGFTFLVPFVFLFNTELVQWDGAQTWITFGFALLGLVFILISVIGYNFHEKVPMRRRILYLFISFPVLFVQIDSVRLILSAILLAVLFYHNRPAGMVKLSRVANRRE